jgi:anti-anti-sigma factor
MRRPALTEERLVEVQLLDVPVAVWKQAAEHQEAVQREFDIIRSSEPDDSLPNRLQALIAELEQRFGYLGDTNQRRLSEAADRGEAAIDLIYQVPSSSGDAIERLAAMLDEVDEYCRMGEHLLTTATPEPLLAFRRWFLGEFERQLVGAPPTPWPSYVDDGSDGDRSADEDAAVALGHELRGDASAPAVVVAGDLDLATVGPLRELIQRLRNEGARRLTLDLSGVDFADSVGIGLLVTTNNRFEEDGGTLTVIVGPRLRSVLEIAGIDGLFDLRPN